VLNLTNQAFIPPLLSGTAGFRSGLHLRQLEQLDHVAYTLLDNPPPRHLVAQRGQLSHRLLCKFGIIPERWLGRKPFQRLSLLFLVRQSKLIFDTQYLGQQLTQ